MSQTTLDGGYALSPESNGPGITPRSATRYMFDTVIPSGVWKDFDWHGFGLPGQGTRPIACGSIGLKICPNQHSGMTYVMPFEKHCNQPTCPHCVESWANQAASRSTSRMLKFRDDMRGGSIIEVRGVPRMSSKARIELASKIKWDLGILKNTTRKGNWKWDTTSLGNPLRFFTQCYIQTGRLKQVGEAYGVTLHHEFTASKRRGSHVSISFPMDMYDKSPEELMKRVRRFMFDVGIIGSVMVWHPARFDKANGWKADVSPHVHMIAFGWIDDVRAQSDKHRLTIVKHRTLRTDGDYFTAMKYILSHAGIRKNRHSLTYWGALSYSKLKVPKDDPEPEKCPHCGEFLVNGRIPEDKYPWITGIPPPFTAGEGKLTDYPLEMATLYDMEYYRWGDGKFEVITSEDIKNDAFTRAIGGKKKNSTVDIIPETADVERRRLENRSLV